MSSGFAHSLQMERIKTAQWRAQRAARREFFESLTPTQLVRHLAQKLEIAAPPADADDLAALLRRQLQVLDTVFLTALHQAGLGQDNTLSAEPLVTALAAQKLCRQTYDSLQTHARKMASAASRKIGKQTEGLENCQQ